MESVSNNDSCLHRHEWYRNRQLAELALLNRNLGARHARNSIMVFLARKCELARQLPASLKPFQMLEKGAKSYMKRFRAAGCEFRILICG